MAERGRPASAQALGSVALGGAVVANPVAQSSLAVGRIAVGDGGSLQAGSHTADLALTRGGNVLVCRTTKLQVSGSAAALQFALGRGAAEFHLPAGPGDAILTPDLRLVPASSGVLDLRLRVVIGGDTCVENRGHRAPILRLTDSFGEASYLVKPGQHVLFERGNLRAVVDHETTPCGCPPDDPTPVPLGLLALAGGPGSVSPAQAGRANPFPAAASEGLGAEPGMATPGSAGVHPEAATTLSLNPSTTLPPAAMPQIVPEPPPPPRPESTNPFRRIGRFFRRLFRPGH